MPVGVEDIVAHDQIDYFLGLFDLVWKCIHKQSEISPQGPAVEKYEPEIFQETPSKHIAADFKLGTEIRPNFQVAGIGIQAFFKGLDSPY